MGKKTTAGLMLLLLLFSIVPGAFASNSSSLKLQPSKSQASKDHSCCPHLHGQIMMPPIAELPPAPMPCGDEHPCCAKRAPENPASLPASGRVERPRIDAATSISASQALIPAPCDATGLTLPYFSPSSFLRTILRI